MKPTDGHMKTMELALEKIRVGLSMHVSPAVLDEAVFELRPDIISGMVEARFEMWLWSNKIHSETRSEDVALTWWDAFKEAYFPRFLKRRFPPRTRQVFIETKFFHVCPHLNYRTRDEERFHLQFLAQPGEVTRLTS